MRVAVTLAIFVAMLALVVVRPRRWPEACWTVAAAALFLALGLVTPREALDATLAGKNALLFLLSLLALSLLVGKSGFFDWAAIRCAGLGRADARVLYRNVFILGAVVTAAMSLDTTAVMLTPVVLVLAKRLALPTAPFVVLCAFVANVGSLLLPISNLTNLLFADAFHLTFVGFAARMLVPQLVALAVTYALLRFHFRGELPARFDRAQLAAPSDVVPSPRYFQLCVGVLIAVLAGYFAAPLVEIEPYIVAFAGVAMLAIGGALTGRVELGAVRELAWGVFPLVIGLFVAVQALENLGAVPLAAHWFTHLAAGSTAQLAATAGTSAAASNVMNNLPAALLARSVLTASHAGVTPALAALVGADVGPLVMPFGSLATVLVLALARREGAELPSGRWLALAVWVTPLVVAATIAALALVS